MGTVAQSDTGPEGSRQDVASNERAWRAPLMVLSKMHQDSENEIYGEVSEWSKEHAWKVCIRQRIEGSNPSLSAIKQGSHIMGLFVLSLIET